jgi:hypothetical protein
MAFKFYIDGQLTDQPVNDTALVTNIRRDQDNSVILMTQQVELSWNANNDVILGTISGYNYLVNLLEDSTCNEADIVIYDQIDDITTIKLYTGTISMPSCKVDRQRLLITCQVSDNSYSAYINNNRSIKVNLAAERTKSYAKLNTLDFYDCDLFNSSGCAFGSSIGFTYKGFRCIDVIDFIVRAISDSKVTVKSDYFDGLAIQPFIFKGQALITSYTGNPSSPEPFIEISFDELFSELSKIYNLIMWVDNTDQDFPILRIEDYESAFDQTLNYTFNDIKELTTFVDFSQNYSNVRVGANQITSGDPSIYPFPSGVSYYGFNEENYFPTGQCNVNKEYNLLNDYIIDSNSIQDALLGNIKNIDQIFLIEIENVDEVNLTGNGAQYNPFNDGSCYYNIGFNNFNKINRHQSKFETQFGNFFGSLPGMFRALLGSNNTANRIYQGAGPASPYLMTYVGNGLFLELDNSDYNNDTTAGAFNNGGNYDNSTFSYTVPSDGFFSFEHKLSYNISGISNPAEFFRVKAIIEHYDSTSTLLQYIEGNAAVSYVNGLQSAICIAVLNCNTNDIIRAKYQIEYKFWTNIQNPDIQNPRYLNLLFDTYLECNGVPEGSAIITDGTKINNYIEQFSFNIPTTEWITIKNNPTYRLNFEKDGVIKYGWIKEISHNDWTGQTNIKLITNNAITTV